MIRFGTDGWRAVIADEFTFENIRIAAQATADYFQTAAEGEPRVVVGYDVRFLSDRFARTAAEVFAGNGFHVLLLDRPYPTPYVSYEVNRLGLVGGIVITASHNPPSFNGFKVKAAYGGSATPPITNQIEALLGKNPVRGSTEGIEIIAPGPDYGRSLRELVDWPQLAASGLRITVDSMHGTGGRLLEELLADTSCRVETIRGEPDPLFGGVAPEPIMPQLEPLAARVRAARSDIGLATDGDADRLGVVADGGRFVSTLEVLPLLLVHLYRRRGWHGTVAYTVSQSQLVGRIAERFGLKSVETPIGFKNIAELMLNEIVLIGGEESGGVGLSRHLPERDGIAIHMLLLDLLAETKKSITELIQDMWTEFGEFHYDRRDLHVPIETGVRLTEHLLEDPPARFCERSVTGVRTLDGIKLMLEPDSWILFRRSGTEPVLRVYTEAPTTEAARQILNAGLDFVEQFPSPGV
jgi:phosphomannomutase